MVAIIGLGNELLSDEGYGIYIIRELKKTLNLSPNVTLIEGGVGGHSLLPLFFEYKYLIFLDVIKVEDEPGSIYLFNMDDLSYKDKLITSFHDIGIEDIYKMAKIMGSEAKCYVIGIVPKCIDEVGSPTDVLISRKEKFISITESLILKCLDNA